MKRSVFSLLTAGSLLLTVAACSGDSGSKDGKDEDLLPAPQVRCDVPRENLTKEPMNLEGAKGEIVFQTQGLKGTFDGFFTKAIEEFEAANPGITVKWTDLAGVKDFDTVMVNQAANCQMADVINVPSPTLLALSKRNFLLDLDTKAPGTGKIYVKDVWDSIGIGYKNAHTAYPWYFGPFATTYNKAIFREAGLDPEQPPKNMDEYFDFADKITEANKDKADKSFAVYGNTKWYLGPQWRAMGVKIMNDDHTKFVFAKDPNAKKWVERMANLYQNGGIPKDSLTGDLDMSKVFSEGRLAYGSPNVSFLKTVKKNSPEVYMETAVGREAVGDKIKPLFSGQFIAVAAASDKAPAALKFAQFIADEQQGLAWAKYGIDTETAIIFPVTTQALDDPALLEPKGGADDPIDKARIVAAQEAKEAQADVSQFYLTGEVNGVLLRHVNAAILGEMTVDEALTGAETKMNDLLDRLLADSK